MQLIILTLLVVFAGHSTSAVSLFGPKRDGDDLEALCRNESISLSRLSHLDLLINKLDNDSGGECQDDTVAAIRDLKSVVDGNRHDECSLTSYERFQRFYERYLDTSGEDKQKALDLPKSLRNLALAYGVQLSGHCRLNMVKELLSSARQVISDKDFESVDRLLDPEGPITKAIGYSGSKPDEMILPSDFAASMKQMKDGKMEKIPLKLRTTPFIRNVQLVCSRRFKPVYVPLMIPVAKLANLGFDHRKKILKEELESAQADTQTKDLISKWTKIVFMCEVLDQIELIEDDKDRENSEGNDATFVHVKTKDEPSSEESMHLQRDVLHETDEDLENLEQIVYSPKLSVNIQDKIYGTVGQKQAVAFVNTDLDQQTKIRMRFIKKVFRRLLKDAVEGRYGKLFGFASSEMKEAIKMIRKQPRDDKDETDADIQTDIVKYMNQLVDGQFNPDRAVSAPADDPAEPVFFALFVGVLLLVAFVTFKHLG